MQPASAAQIQPAVSLLGKTPQLVETLLGDLPGEFGPLSSIPILSKTWKYDREQLV